MKNKRILILLFVLLMFSSVFSEEIQKGSKTFGNNYLIFFQISEYNLKISDTIEYIFNDMIKKEDHLTIFTPVKPYGYSQKTRKSQTKEKLIALTKDVVRRDIVSGTSTYHQILNDMKGVVNDIKGTFGIDSSTNSQGNLKTCLINYRRLKNELIRLRKLNEKLFVKLAKMLKQHKGKNSIYIVYQRENRIIPNHLIMDLLMKNVDVKYDASEVFLKDNIKEFLNVENVTNILKKSNITLNFLYITSKDKAERGTELREFSGDVYSVFSKLAKNTGGVIISSTKPQFALKKAVEKK